MSRGPLANRFWAAAVLVVLFAAVRDRPLEINMVGRRAHQIRPHGQTPE